MLPERSQPPQCLEAGDLCPHGNLCSTVVILGKTFVVLMAMLSLS